MTIEQLLSEVQSSGLLVNNLFQLDDGGWRCSLRDESGGYGFGDGEDAAAAIRSALFSAKNGNCSSFIENAIAEDALAEFLKL